MTYRYRGARGDRGGATASPGSGVGLGGVYATLCTGHARTLGTDLGVVGQDLEPLWDLLGLKGEAEALHYWEGYERLETGVLKLTEGCPFRCTYCSVPQLYPKFSGDVERALAEMDLLHQRGVRRLAF